MEVIGGVSQQPTLPPTGPCSSSTPIVTPRMKTPKFDRGRLRWNRRRRRTSNCSNNSVDGENANTNNIKRASNSSTPSFYEEFSSPLEVDYNKMFKFRHKKHLNHIRKKSMRNDNIINSTGWHNFCRAYKATRNISWRCSWEWPHQ